MDDLDQIRRLAGIGNSPNWTAYTGINVSITGTEKAQLQREHKIEPGTDTWFRLWFSRPLLTKETPI
jgi:hypothetical protein